MKSILYTFLLDDNFFWQDSHVLMSKFKAHNGLSKFQIHDSQLDD